MTTTLNLNDLGAKMQLNVVWIIGVIVSIIIATFGTVLLFLFKNFFDEITKDFEKINKKLENIADELKSSNIIIIGLQHEKDSIKQKISNLEILIVGTGERVESIHKNYSHVLQFLDKHTDDIIKLIP